MGQEDSTFNIDEIGEYSGVHYQGKFELKYLLSFNENFLVDQFRRQCLGDTTGAPASPDAEVYAQVFSELRYRLKECPDWWKNSGWGTGLKDPNVINKVWEEAQKKLKVFFDSKKKAKEAAQTDLKAEAKNL